jgi:hypothetical protein
MAVVSRAEHCIVATTRANYASAGSSFQSWLKLQLQLVSPVPLSSLDPSVLLTMLMVYLEELASLGRGYSCLNMCRSHVAMELKMANVPAWQRVTSTPFFLV